MRKPRDRLCNETC